MTDCVTVDFCACYCLLIHSEDWAALAEATVVTSLFQAKWSTASKTFSPNTKVCVRKLSKNQQSANLMQQLASGQGVNSCLHSFFTQLLPLLCVCAAECSTMNVLREYHPIVCVCHITCKCDIQGLNLAYIIPMSLLVDVNVREALSAWSKCWSWTAAHLHFCWPDVTSERSVSIRIDLEEWEHVTCMKTVALRSQETVSGLKGYIAAGTCLMQGEEVTCRGRVSSTQQHTVVLLQGGFSYYPHLIKTRSENRL